MIIDKNKVEIALAKKIMTKKQLSIKSEIRPQNLTKILEGKICEPHTVGKIARALEVDVEEIVAMEV